MFIVLVVVGWFILFSIACGYAIGIGAKWVSSNRDAAVRKQVVKQVISMLQDRANRVIETAEPGELSNAIAKAQELHSIEMKIRDICINK